MSSARRLLDPRILGTILWKDLQCLWPLALLAACVFGGDVLIVKLELLPVWSFFRFPLAMLAASLLIAALFQLDGPVSLSDDWLCRPVPKRELLAAKLLLVLALIYGSRGLASLLAGRLLGHGWAESLLDALLLQDVYFQLLLPILFMAAVVTRTQVQAIGLLLALFVAVFIVPTPLVQPPGPLQPAIGEALGSAGLNWLSMAPPKLLMLPLLAWCFWLAYWRRRITQARLLLLAGTGLTVLLVVLPMWLLPWNTVLAVQTSLARQEAAATELAAAISLRPLRQCFPAARLGELSGDSAFTTARQYSGLPAWNAEQLRAAGPDSLTFLSSLEARGLPLDWRVKLLHVQADYRSADGSAQLTLRPASFFSDSGSGSALAHAWVLPQQELARLGAAGEPSLELRYSLALLAPQSFDLPSDGLRRHLPGLGYCSASRAALQNRVEVDCFSARHPGQISAELGGIAASRVYSLPDFAPAWVALPRGHRTELLLDSPGLSPHHHVTLTAWRPAGFFRKSWTADGLLGGDSATCPLPALDRNVTPLLSRWSDATHHETLYLAVDDGVQLEVLDFGGSGPALLLLPGLGATAHAFDTLGPKLAQRYRVFALTRRGSGASSRPDHGYATGRLAQDVVAVLDALGLTQAVLAGHSIAGDELSWLGARQAERVQALIYLDAAYERDSARPPNRRLRELSALLPPEPPPRVEDLLNYPAFKAFRDRRGGVHIPEGELLAFRHVANPYLAGAPNMDPRVADAITAAIGTPDYASIRVPALALYATRSGEVIPKPWEDSSDAALMAALAEREQLLQAEQRVSIERLRTELPSARVVELPGADHWIFLSHESEVLGEIDAFLGGLGLGP